MMSPQHFLQHFRVGGFLRVLGFVVGDEVTQHAVFFIAHRLFKAARVLVDLDDLLHLVGVELKDFGQFIHRGLPAQILGQLVTGAGHAVDLLVHVHGHADGAGPGRQWPRVTAWRIHQVA